MGNKYTEAQAKATKAYLATKDEIKIRIDKGERDHWKQVAKDKGFSSLSAFVVACVEKEMNRA